MMKNCDGIFSCIDTVLECDRQTDGQTVRITELEVPYLDWSFISVSECGIVRIGNGCKSTC